MDTLPELLRALAERGIRLFVEDGRLGYDAPEGAFDDELTAAVVARKAEIIALLSERSEHSGAGVGQPPPVEFERGPVERGPLSFAQRRMWFSAMWDPSSPGYNMPIVLEVDGDIDPAVLQVALDRLVADHPILRTRYLSDDGEPVQEPIDEATVDLTVEEVAAPGSTGDDEEAALDRFFAVPFELERQVPLRCRVVTRGGRPILLLLNLHHIAGDAQTAKLVVAKLAELYAAVQAGVALDTTSAYSYADYVRWERTSWDTGRFDGQLEYWRHRLADHHDPVVIPGDRKRPEVSTEDGDTLLFTFDAEVKARVDRYCQQRGLTPFAFFLTAALLVLHRYAGRDRVALGSTVAGRNRPEIADVLGCFINTIVLTAHFEPERSLAACVTDVQRDVLEALDHQDIPFHKLVDELDVRRDLAHAPFFQNMFVFDNLEGSGRGRTLGSATLRQRTYERKTSKSDTTIRMRELTDGYAGRLTYRRDLFDRETMERYVGHFGEVVEILLVGDDRTVADIELGSVAAQHEALAVTTANGDDRLAVERFRDAAAADPAKVAVHHEGETITYGDLARRSAAVARHLRSTHRAGPGVRVATLLDRSIDSVVAILGVLQSGAAYVPIDPGSPMARIELVLGLARPATTITTRSVRDLLEGDLPGEVLDLDDLDLDGADLEGADLDGAAPGPDGLDLAGVGDVGARPTAEETMYVIFTSGSTGEPKGVEVTHGNIRNYLNGLVTHLDLTAEWSHAMVTTFAADLNVTTLYGALTTGATLHVIGYERAVSPAALAEYFEANPIDVIKIAPSHFRALIDHAGAIIPRRCLIFSGEACPWDLVRTVRRLRPDVRIENHYGPTETTVSALMNTIGVRLPIDPPGVVPVGRPIPNVVPYVLDRNRRPVPIGVAGELHLGGPGVSKGYLDRPELTAAVFHPALDVAEEGPGGGTGPIYQTGDRVRITNDGVIEFLGRGDNQVKIRGYRVELDEVRLACTAHPRCADGVVRAYEVADGVQGLVAYVVVVGDRAEAVAEIRAHLRTTLPDHLRPNVIVPIDAIPVTANGKLDVAALPEPRAERSDTGGEAVAPSTETERYLAEAWAQVLAVEGIGIDDDFFDLGGDSFTAIKLMNGLDPDRVGTLSIMDLFRFPTIRALAARADGTGGDGPDGETDLDDQGRRRLVTRMRGAADAEVSLVCVPFGGGSAISYQPMSYRIPDDYALYTVELPGHEYDRTGEELAPLPEVADRCAAEIAERCQGRIYLYGHCLGASMAMAIAARLEARGVPLAGVFLAGSLPTARPDGFVFRLAARLFPRDRWGSTLRYQQLMQSLGASGMDSEDQIDFVIRNLRHDSRQAEDYNTAVLADPDYVKVAAPVLCIFGEYDPSTENFMTRYPSWEAHAERVEVAMIPQGGHFFLKELSDRIVDVIERQRAIWDGAETELPEPYRPPDAEELELLGASAERRVRPSFLLFVRVVLAVFLSGMGAQMLTFGLGVWVLQETGSVVGFAATLFFNRMPNILLLPVGGAVADKVDRRLVLVASTAVMTAASIALGVAHVTTGLSLWMIYLHAFVVAAGAAFADPAYLAARTQLVPRYYLAYSNGVAQLGGALVNFTAPAIGAFFMVWLGIEAMFAIRLISAVVALAILFVTPFPLATMAMTVEPFLVSLRQGFLFIIRRRGMVAMVLFFVVSNFMMGVITAQITPMVLGFASVAAVGFVTSSRAVGGIAGSLVASVWAGFRRRATGMVGFVLLSGLSAVLIGIQPSVALVALGVFGMGMAQVLTNTHWETIIQNKVGIDLQGRVFATNRMMARSALPLGILAGGALSGYTSQLTVEGGAVADTIGWFFGVGAHRGQALILVGAGVWLSIWAVAGLRYRPLRYVEDSMPDAISYEGFEGDLDALQRQFDELYQTGDRVTAGADSTDDRADAAIADPSGAAAPSGGAAPPGDAAIADRSDAAASSGGDGSANGSPTPLSTAASSPEARR